MILTKEDYDYLTGKEFSGNYSFKFDNNVLYDRITTIINLTKGKNILHVGCCDHIPLIEGKVANKTWLHGLLETSCENVVGVDINEEAVKFVNKKNYGKNPVVYGDITSDDFSIDLRGFDYVLMGEIVEHVNNPIDFLSRASGILKRNGFEGRYIITVPNALCMCRSVFGGVERINSDHRFWFTPYTICKVMIEAGLYPEELLFSSFAKGGNGKNRYTNKLFSILEGIRKKPCSYKSWRGDQIVAIGKF